MENDKECMAREYHCHSRKDGSCLENIIQDCNAHWEECGDPECHDGCKCQDRDRGW